MNLSGLVSGDKPPVCVSAPVWNYQGLIRVETPKEEMITMLLNYPEPYKQLSMLPGETKGCVANLGTLAENVIVCAGHNHRLRNPANESVAQSGRAAEMLGIISARVVGSNPS